MMQFSFWWRGVVLYFSVLSRFVFRSHFVAQCSKLNSFSFCTIFYVFVQLYFTLVRDNHWVVCTVNVLLGQINVFDSLRNVNSDSLMRSVDNIVSVSISVDFLYLFT